MDWLQVLAFVMVGLGVLVALVVTAYWLAWAVASGWARGRLAVPDPDQDYRADLDRIASGGW